MLSLFMLSKLAIINDLLDPLVNKFTVLKKRHFIDLRGHSVQLVCIQLANLNYFFVLYFLAEQQQGEELVKWLLPLLSAQRIWRCITLIRQNQFRQNLQLPLRTGPLHRLTSLCNPLLSLADHGVKIKLIPMGSIRRYLTHGNLCEIDGINVLLIAIIAIHWPIALFWRQNLLNVLVILRVRKNIWTRINVIDVSLDDVLLENIDLPL